MAAADGRCLAGATADIAAERGLQLSGWTIDPRDYDGRDPVTMHEDVNKSLDANRETVVLLHDGHREHGAQNRRPDAGNTVALTGLLLAEDDNAFTVLGGGLIDGLGLGPPDDRLSAAGTVAAGLKQRQGVSREYVRDRPPQRLAFRRRPSGGG